MNLDFHKNHRLLFAVVLGGFIVLSYIAAVWPALSVENDVEPLPGSATPTAQERAGLDVYLSEGCAYCHTQQVRPLTQDTTRYGRASVARDYARIAPRGPWRQAPRILGTERTGPDLTSVGERQPSAVWQYIHLYQPRAVVPGSVMPAFPWLFETKASAGSNDVVVPLPASVAPKSGVVVARPEAQELVAYLLSLHQAPLEGGKSTGASQVAVDDQGRAVYSSRCASCHQPNGEGVSGAFPPLVGNAVVTATDPTRHVEIVLFGVSGQVIDGVSYASAMPAWEALLSDEEVAAVVNHERSSWGNSAPHVTAEFVAGVRAKGATP